MTGPLGIVDSATLLAAFENYVDMVMETDFKWFKNLSASAFTSLVLCLSKPHCVNIIYTLSLDSCGNVCSFAFLQLCMGVSREFPFGQ